MVKYKDIFRKKNETREYFVHIQILLISSYFYNTRKKNKIILSDANICFVQLPLFATGNLTLFKLFPFSIKLKTHS